MTFTSNIGKNGLTFIHMNEPLWRTIQSRMHCEKEKMIEKTGVFGTADNPHFLVTGTCFQTSLPIIHGS